MSDMDSVQIHLTEDWNSSGEKYWLSHSSASVDPPNIKTNGFYSYIVDSQNKVIASVDHIRSIPIFYATNDNKILISDDSDWIARQIPPQESFIADIEYQLTGYVTERNTRHPEIKQLLPGESLYWDGNSINTKRHFRFQYDHHGNQTPRTAKRKAETAIQRLIDYADGRQIILPLSGGLDSRLISALLVKKGYENVKSFTYGRSGSSEAKIGKKRAAALGIDWQFIEYNHARWQAWYSSHNREDFYEYENDLASIPHIEMGPALANLRAQPKIEKDAVIVPGHSGDMLAGSHLPQNLCGCEYVSRQDVVDTILKDHYCLSSIPSDQRSVLTKRLTTQLEIPKRISSKRAAEAYESWDYRNRQSGFIVNSMRAVESHGFDWYLPLWDREFTNFWLKVPLNQRINKQMYNQMVADIWTTVTGEGIVAATKTERSSLSHQLKETVRDSAVELMLRKLYDRVQTSREYGSHPLAWYGIIPKEIFTQYYTGREHINTFIAKERVGEISF